MPLRKIIRDPSTNPPKPMFQLSEILYKLQNETGAQMLAVGWLRELCLAFKIA